MNKKTIAIFQNEWFDETTKGTPNIIELIDSEINVENKCIYMVMEMGDIDLSHLLKKAKQGESCCKKWCANDVATNARSCPYYSSRANVHSDLNQPTLCVRGPKLIILE